MHCPELNDLPAPPAGRTGWPWTEETPGLPAMACGGGRWPRISIVTPSYNQGRFIEETIRSVLLQGYPDLEYIIIDGGSSDNSVEIVKKYSPWLAYWVSAPDRGQSHAINKGFERATGEVLAWLNSDDLYVAGALRAVGATFAGDPARLWVAGVGRYVDEGDRELYTLRPQTPSCMAEYLAGLGGMAQPSAFWRRALWEKAGGRLRERMHYCMDEDLWIRFALAGARPHALDAALCVRRIHALAKTATDQAGFVEDMAAIVGEYGSRVPPAEHEVWRRLVWRRAGSCAEGGFIALRKGELGPALRIFRSAVSLSPLGAFAAVCSGVRRRTRRLLCGLSRSASS